MGLSLWKMVGAVNLRGSDRGGVLSRVEAAEVREDFRRAEELVCALRGYFQLSRSSLPVFRRDDHVCRTSKVTLQFQSS